MSAKTDNSSYQTTIIIGASKVKQVLWYFANVLFFLNPLNPFSRLKVFLLRLYGAKIGKGVVVKPGVNIKFPWKLIIGDYVWIGEKVWIDNLDGIEIKSNACLSQGAFLLCGSHNYKKSSFDLIVGEIVIEEGVWIGANAIVTGGLTCASHSVLTANSVATSNLDACGIYQGNPAVKIRERVIND